MVLKRNLFYMHIKKMASNITQNNYHEGKAIVSNYKLSNDIYAAMIRKIFLNKFRFS